MNPSITRICGVLLAASFAAGGGVTQSALAQAQPTAPAAPMSPHRPPMGDADHHGERGGMHGGHRMMRDVERLRTSLKLTANQNALWDKAQGLMRPPPDGREQMKARHDRLAAMLDDPNFDPRQLAADMDSGDNERRARMTAIRDAWFAVYDSLNPVQRGQAREFLRSHMAHPHRMGGEGGGWMHGPEGGKPPMR